MSICRVESLVGKLIRSDPGGAIYLKYLGRRSEVGMTMHCMRSYTLLVIKTCHRRGVHAMGGMAAHIPIRDDPAANQARLLLPS